LILDSLMAAAYELSDPEHARELVLPSNSAGGAPRVMQLPCRVRQADSISGTNPVVAQKSGRTRVWGTVALRKLKEATPNTHVNSFVLVALRWASGILREVRERIPFKMS
jgi:hypothetical protein